MRLSVLAVIASLMASACDSSSPPPAPSAPPDAGVLGSLTDAAVLDDANPPDAKIPDGGVPDGAVPDAAVPDAAPNVVAPDAAAPDAGVTCASPPVQAYVGEQSEHWQGGGSETEDRAEVTWTLTSTVGCVDHYTPSGRIYDEYHGPCAAGFDPDFGEIEPGDGELIIDRSSSPATYTVRGESYYQTTMDGQDHCDDSPTQVVTLGGLWAESSGSFDGALIAGGLSTQLPTRHWHLVASNALFMTPTTGCSEPAQERWTSAHHWAGSEATVSWTRVETNGCVDRYTPGGTASVVIDPTDPCTYAEPTGPIAADDGSLEVDRSTDPPTLRFLREGITRFQTEQRCPGQTPSQANLISSWGFGWIHQAFDGTRWSGAYLDYSWSFARGD